MTTRRRYPAPIPELIADDAAGVDLVAIERAMSGEYPTPRLTRAERVEMARMMADRATQFAHIWHSSGSTARRRIDAATRGAA